MRFPAQRCPQRALLALAAGSSFHPVGSCAMGIGSDHAVAPDVTVDGIEGLRAVDASVISTIVSDNTNIAAIMIARRGPPPSAGETGTTNAEAGSSPWRGAHFPMLPTGLQSPSPTPCPFSAAGLCPYSLTRTPD
ncbi:GMC oxidoreductase [Streptomyces viridochromogenes]|uniref:GMC oxidoreductase n=1 Tax=Streptomyces viridochromogenes TaxID=1938 RepID=UPI00099B6ABF|nr:GMC oxidoreductase [Streptomyces viridochromogenes]